MIFDDRIRETTSHDACIGKDLNMIGDDCLIESGAVIGGCGFGTYLDEEGHPELVPHPAGVTIGDHVKIFANTCIVRGCLSDTII